MPLHRKVLTPGHLRFWFSERMKTFGVKIAAEAADANTGGVPIKAFARGGGSPAADGARLMAARQSNGLPLARKILYEGLKSRASAIVLDFAPTSVAIRYLVDGVWMPQEPIEREGADPALDALKSLCGLEPKERRAKQAGKFGVEYSVLRKENFAKMDKAEKEYREQATMELTRRLASDELQPPRLQIEVAKAVEEQARQKFATPLGAWTPIDKEKLPRLPGIDALHPMTSLEPVKTTATLTCQGTPTGERVVVEFEVKGIHLATLDDLGMRAKMQEQLKEVLNRPKGFVILSAIPAGGLRTTTKVLLFSLDRFVREFAAVEDESNRYDETENVPVTTYQSKAGQSPADILPRVFRSQPNVVVVRDLVNAKTVKLICEEIDDGRADGDQHRAGERQRRGPACGSTRSRRRRFAEFRDAGHGRALAAAGSQALRQVQGALHPAGGSAQAVGAAGRQGQGLLSSAHVQERRGGQAGDLPRMRRRRLPGPDGHFRADGRRRPPAEDAGRHAQARRPPHGRAQDRHEDACRRKGF